VGAAVKQLSAGGHQIADLAAAHVSQARFTPVNSFGKYAYGLDTNRKERVLRTTPISPASA